jgi:ribosome-associated protein
MPRVRRPRGRAGHTALGLRTSGVESTKKGKVAAKNRSTKGTGRRTAPRRAGAARKQRPDSKELALAIAAIGLDKKALNVEIIDVRGKSDYTDYVVVMSGRSDRQVGAIADHVLGQAASKLGSRCLGIEGLPHGLWVLMDYGDVVVHIFHEDTRGYYDLESLWIDAARVSV